jgi:amidase
MYLHILIGTALAAAALSTGALAQDRSFDVTEKSILELQAAQSEGRLTARELATQYLARIRAYDQSGPSLNAMVVLNPLALQEADQLDRERRSQGPRGPLHGIPVVLKDNFLTKDMPTSGGTLALATFRPQRDAYQVERLRRAGAIVLGKTTLHELAAGITTISSFTGATRNPYDLGRVPGGSSGGTAVAVAASFAAAGMGSDTCGSIRIPAGNQNLVGLRVTRGLSSRAGVIPLSSTQDEAGPLARSVMDLALMLDATVGEDPSDPVTAGSRLKIPASYAQALQGATLRGKRIGVLNSLFGQAPEDAEVAGIVRKTLNAMKAQGAELVDITIPDLDALMRDGNVIAHEFKFDFSDFLQHQPGAPIKSLQEIIDGGLDHDQLDAVFRLRNATQERHSQAYRTALAKQGELKDRMVAAIQAERLDAVAYPVLRRKAVRIGDVQTGFTCQLSANSGLPAMSVPAGFTDDGVPVGLELTGQPYQEVGLLQLAHAWEQTAQPRRVPFSTPPLIAGAAPQPQKFRTTTGPADRPRADVDFTYEATTGTLHYAATLHALGADDVVAVTLQRGSPDRPGPILGHLLRQGQGTGTASLQLQHRDRSDLAAGRLFLHLYTRQDPLGAGRARMELPAPDTGPQSASRTLPSAML